jgi:hypothetical protein
MKAKEHMQTPYLAKSMHVCVEPVCAATVLQCCAEVCMHAVQVLHIALCICNLRPAH